MLTGTQLNVPYYNQTETEWCWATSISMLVRHYGFDRKPWQVAADFDKAPSSPITWFGAEPVRSYLNNYYDPQGTNPWDSQTVFASLDTMDGDIRAVLSSGDPVLLSYNGSGSVGHVVVLTGFDGTTSSDHVFVNDPSGALTSVDPDRPSGVQGLVNYPMRWDNFHFAMGEQFFLPGVRLIYAKPSTLSSTATAGSIQLRNTTSTPFYFSNSADGSQHSLLFSWDGTEPYAGYRYDPYAPFGQTWYQQDNDGLYDNYGYNATQADVLYIHPSYSLFDLSGGTHTVRTHAEIRRANDGTLVKSMLSATDTLTGSTWSASPSNASISAPMSGLGAEVYTLKIILEEVQPGGSVTQLDQNVYYFGITAYTQPDSTKEILSKAVDGINTSSGLFDSVDESDGDHDVRQQRAAVEFSPSSLRLLSELEHHRQTGLA